MAGPASGSEPRMVEPRSGLQDRRRAPRGGRRSYDRAGRNPAILVADSYAGARRPVARYLHRFNFSVAEAATGEEALARIAAVPPRVVLIEWSLPMMGGERLTHWLAQGWRSREVRVIALANRVERELEMVRADGVLVKPFALTAMIDEIRRVLRQS